MFVRAIFYEHFETDGFTLLKETDTQATDILLYRHSILLFERVSGCGKLQQAKAMYLYVICIRSRVALQSRQQ